MGSSSSVGERLLLTGASVSEFANEAIESGEALLTIVDQWLVQHPVKS